MFKDNDNTDTRELDIARIVPVQDREGEPVVSGRALHYFLEVGTEYSKWVERMLEYGFTEGVDHVVTFDDMPSAAGGRAYRRADHLLSLDMAKELAMIQRTARGKQARQYFIAVEKRARQQHQIPQTYAEALALAASQASELEAKSAQIEADRPKVLFADAVQLSQKAILVGQLAVILRDNGVDIGANRLFEWLRAEGYLVKRKGADWNRPTQRSMDLGVMTVVERPIFHNDGHTTISITPMITGKGQVYFCEKFLTEAVAA